MCACVCARSCACVCDTHTHTHTHTQTHTQRERERESRVVSCRVVSCMRAARVHVVKRGAPYFSCATIFCVCVLCVSCFVSLTSILLIGFDLVAAYSCLLAFLLAVACFCLLLFVSYCTW